MTGIASKDPALQGQPPIGDSRVFRGLVAVRTLGAFADSAMLPFIIVWARHDVGLSGAIAGLLFLAQAIGELVGGLAGGMLADRLGHRRILLVATVGYVLLIAAVLLMALGQMLYAPTVSAFTSRLAAPGHIATYQAALSTTEDIGTAIGPTTGLALGGLGGSRLIWLLAGPLCLLAALGSAHASRKNLLADHGDHC